ncbi:MAG: methionine--tRNA ligase subunit beta [Candidatus Nanohalarchaeota archaeon]|nr:MAG: methionine--tRNA ligase subunit beta [Candidatus Nanohaloarchaeota archaeon]
MDIEFSDFEKLQIKIGKILSAQKIEGTDKLVKMEVDMGDEDKRQIIAGIARSYEPEELIGKQVPVLANLKPRKIRGLQSQGMILVIDANEKLVLLHPQKEVPPGSEVN